MRAWYDVSSTAGSFAIPFDAVASGEQIVAVLSNSTDTAISLSKPTD